MRRNEFDIIKGIAIFLVVMGHILLYGIEGGSRTPLFRLIGIVHMPLFFFISGWWAMKVGTDGKVLAPNLWDRAVRLLPPAFVVSFLWYLYYPHSPVCMDELTYTGMMTAKHKGGYWFPFTLFEITALYTLAVMLFRIRKGIITEVCVCLALWGSTYIITAASPQWLQDCLILPPLRNHFPAFVMGAFAHRYYDGFRKLCQSNIVRTAAVVTLVVIALVFENGRSIKHFSFIYSIIGQPFIFSMAVLMMTICGAWSARAAEDGKSHPFMRMWVYLGKRSFAIYLLHYFFLFRVPFGNVFLTSVRDAFVPTVIIASAAAAAVISVTLLADYIICRSDFLGFILAGNPLKRASKKQ